MITASSRRKIFRVFLVLVAWGTLGGGVWWIVPCAPRISIPLSKYASFEIAPDFKTVLIWSDKPTDSLQLWDLQTREVRLDFTSEEKRYYSSFSPDGSLLAVQTAGELRLWETATGRLAHTLPCSEDWYYFSPDATTLVAPHRGSKTVILFDLSLGRERDRLEFADFGRISAVQFSPDGAWLTVRDRTGNLALCETSTGHRRATLKVEPSSRKGAFPLQFSKDGRTLVYYDEDVRRLKLWNLPSATHRPMIATNYREIGFSGDGKILASKSPAGIQVWEVATCRVRSTFSQPPDEICIRDLNHSGTRLTIYNSVTEKIELWDITENPARRLLENLPMSLNVKDGFSPDGRYLAAAEENAPSAGQIVVYDLRTMQCQVAIPTIWEVFVLGDYIFSPAGDAICLWHDYTFSPDGNTIAVRGNRWPNSPMSKLSRRITGKRAALEYHTELWDIPTGKRTGFLSGCDFHSFSADGRCLAAVNEGDDRQLQIWDVPPKKPLGKIIAWALGLGLYVFAIRWICWRMTRARNSFVPSVVSAAVSLNHEYTSRSGPSSSAAGDHGSAGPG